MARKRKQKQSGNQALTSAERSERFRLRYQDGVVEIGLGCMLFLLTILNLSEYFVMDGELVHVLLILQPFLSLLLFASGVFLIRFLRDKVLEKRNDVQHVPLSKPMLWINLVMLLLLITAQLIWPLQRYDANVLAWVFGGMGCVSGLLLLILGVHHHFQRFMLIGGVIFVLSAVFTFIGQPGYLTNQLVILVGVSATFLISGGYTLWRFLHGVSLH